MVLRFDYICIKWFIICFGKKLYLISLNEFVKNQNTHALLDSILLCIVYNCLLDVWLTPSSKVLLGNRNFASLHKVQGKAGEFLGDINNA